MICTLNDTQKGSVIDRIGKILANPIESATITPEWLIKNVYDGFYEAFVKKSLIDKAEPYAVEAARYAAENLYQILSGDKAAAFRQNFQIAAQNEAAFTEQSIQKYTNIDQLREFLNLKDVELKFTPPTVTEAQVQPVMDTIKKAFPQLKDFTTFQTPEGLQWRFATLKEGEQVLRFPEVTDFLYSKKAKSVDVLETRALKIGTLSDYIVRQFIKSPMDYVEFRKKMAGDPSVIQSFASFTTGDSMSTVDLTDPLMATYMDDFIKDLTYGIDYIMKQYEGFHLTDLTSLLEDANVPAETKERFFIYSKEVGLRGELDILAISPNGTFTVIDIKTAGSEVKRTTESKYQTQASIYDLIIEKATGLKSAGKIDIVYLTTSLSNPSNTLVKNLPGRYKAGITAYSKVTLPTKDGNQLVKDITAYKAGIEARYSKEIVATPKNPVFSRALNIPFPGKRPGGMKMLLAEAENRSTAQDLLKGKTWLEETFPEMPKDSIKIVNDLLNSGIGGEFMVDAITLYERSNKGVAYHEGWHRFSQLFLTKAEKMEMYGKVRDRKKDFTTRDGRELNTATAPLIDIEEFLAEEFKNYALRKDQRSSLRKFFDKILDILKAISNYFKANDSYAFQRMYNQVYNGSFNRSNFNVNNSMFTYLNSLYVDSVNGKGEILDNFTFNEFRQFIDYEMSRYMQSEDVTIVNLMTGDGVGEITVVIKDSLDRLIQHLDDRIAEAEQYKGVINNEAEKRKIDATIKDWQYFKASAQKILETTEGKQTNLAGFIRAYFKTSDMETMRSFNKKNRKRVEDRVDDVLEDTIEAGEQDTIDSDDPVEQPASPEEGSEYNRSGNEEEVMAMARAELKDFFVGIPRLKTRVEAFEDPYEYTKGGVPLVLPREEAFYKLLELTAGTLDWDGLLRVLRDPDSQSKFPEIVTIQDRILGSPNNEGLFVRWKRMSAEINGGDFSNLDEHANLTSFMMHFASVFTMFKMPFENPTLKLNYENKMDSEVLRNVRPIGTRESMEMIINNIINDFTKGFQKNQRSDFAKAYKESQGQEAVKEEEVDDFLKGYQASIAATTGNKIYTDVFELMHNVFVEEADPDKVFNQQLPGVKYLYDPIVGTFYYNPFYANSLAHTTLPNEKQMKEFFRYMGITINDKAYQSTTDFKQLQTSYNQMKSVGNALGKKSKLAIVNLLSNNGLKQRLTKWKEASDRLKALSAQGESTMRVALEAALAAEQFSLRGYISEIFPFDPVQQMLFDSQDKKLMKTDHGKVFAINRMVFEKMAKVEKAYHKNFSSGSMLVKDDLQFSYFLRNQMNIITSRINNDIDHIDDFDRYPELAHINPKLNPQILNSFIFSRLFNKETGAKNPGIKMDLTNIANVTIINQNGDIEVKKVSELKEDEKLLFDICMIESEGSAEMRRMEASNTANRLGVSQILANGESSKIKAIKKLTSFSQPAFLERLKGYATHSAFKYKFFRDEANRDASSSKEWQKKNLDNMSIFDEMTPKSISKIKTIVEEYTGDMNNIMVHIEKLNPELMKQFEKEIADYFEGITIKNEDSFRKYVDETLSEKSITILSELSAIQADRNPIQLINNKLTDNILRDFIANDFIMAMEDSLLFFGDYTNYEDPSKRRKILANNGSIHAIDPHMKEALDAQASVSLSAIYRNAKGITSTKDRTKVSKLIMQDITKDSKIVAEDKDGKIELIKDIVELRQQKFGVTESYEKVEKDKVHTLSAFRNMKLADAGAYISLDTYRAMLMRERRWLPEMEDEYKRQQLILKDKMSLPITDLERKIINTPTKGFFNVAKFALTGPVYTGKPGIHLPSFDKMGLRVLLPEYDFSTTMRPVFEFMLANEVDYVAFDSASKGFTPTIHKSFDRDTMMSVFANNEQKRITQHAGTFFKNQLNTSDGHSKSTFSSQLRGIFFEIILIREKYGKTSKELESTYKGLIKSLSDYITVNSSKALSEMGLDTEGKIKDKQTFINYLKGRLMDNDTVSVDLIERLSINNDDSLATALEALPFQREIGNLLAGVIDDNFRKIKLNGSKLIQSQELGTQDYKRVREGDLTAEGVGTVELKWHGLKRDSKGNFTETTEVEVKVNFKKQWEPLFNLIHPDGKPIGTYASSRVQNIRRLNEALRNEDFVNRNKSSFTFIGVRIPLQDINFSSHMIVKEFLPEAVGDMIIAPPEFYQQTGSDNDIDSVTVTFKYLDDRGKMIKKSSKSYEEIVNRISEISTEISKEKGEVSQAKTLPDIQLQLDELKKDFINENIYFEKGKTLTDLERDFELVQEDGMYMIQGQKNTKSTFFQLFKDGEHNVEVEAVLDFIWQLNKGSKNITSPLKKELNGLLMERKQYIEGLTNDIITSIEKFMKLPETYDFLTETDSIEKIKEMAVKNISNLTGAAPSTINLAQPLTSLQNMSYRVNQVNHVNNFEIRTILGSIVKFRRLLTTLAKLDLSIEKNYTSGSIAQLQEKFQSDNLTTNIFGEKIDTKNPNKSKPYARHIYTPLLYTKDTEKGIKISIFDENGERITKNLSMLTSSLLDLFKNADIFPSLGINWLNVKTSIFLITQGVPLDRVVLFMNNPIVQEVDKMLKKKGSSFQDRHALVMVSQSIFKDEGDAIHPYADPHDMKLIMSDKSVYAPTVVAELNGPETVNQMMRRHGKASQEYLTNNVTEDFKISAEDLTNFTRDYGEFTRTEPIASRRNLPFFLRNSPYRAQAKTILAYYSTLLEDGDNFYKLYIKSLNRDAVKHNSPSSIATAENTKKLRQATGMINPEEYESKIETESTQSPFFNDKIVKNILGNTMPRILNHPNTYFRDKFLKKMEEISSGVRGTVEYKNKVDYKVTADFIDLLHKNFTLIYEQQGAKMVANTPYEWYEWDITPLLRPLQGKENFAKFIEGFNQNQQYSLSADTRIETSFSGSLFSRQMDTIKMKYPELDTLKLLNEHIVERIVGVDPGTTDFEAKDVLNLLDQNYARLNLASNPKERADVERIIREEWTNLLNFNLSSFPEIENEVGKDPIRVDFYNKAENIEEIQTYFRKLGEYALVQSSHLATFKGSFAHLVPNAILKEKIETALDNFDRFLDGVWDNGQQLRTEKRNEVIDQILLKFGKLFRDMNGDLQWQIQPNITTKRTDGPVDVADDMDPGEREPAKKNLYKPYKKEFTGKLYGKLGIDLVTQFQQAMMKSKGVTGYGHNAFAVNPFKINNDPLNCTI